MTNTARTSEFQRAIDVVEALSIEEQQLLLELLLNRLREQRRNRLLQEVQEVRQEVAAGKVQYGSVKDFLDLLR